MRRACLFAAGVCAGVIVFANANATAQNTTLDIRLQPNSKEPQEEPKRVRVDNRSLVTVHVAGLSPLDVCSLSGRTPTAVVETNAIGSLITLLSGSSGLGGKVGGGGLGNVSLAVLESVLSINFDQIMIVAQPADPTFTEIMSLKTEFDKERDEDADEQSGSAVDYLNESNRIATYFLADYRGAKFIKFKPADDLKSSRDVSLQDLPSLAKAQALSNRISSRVAAMQTMVDAGFKPPAGGTQIDIDAAKQTYQRLADDLPDALLVDANAKESMGRLVDRNTTLKGAATALKTAYDAAVLVFNSFQYDMGQLPQAMRDAGVTTVPNQQIFVKDGALYQNFVLAPDRLSSLRGC